jgi:ferredoxin
MDKLTSILLLTCALITVSPLTAFSWLSWREDEPRAMRISGAAAVLIGASLAASATLPLIMKLGVLLFLAALLLIAVILFMLPIGSVQAAPDIPHTRYDERDIPFSRIRLQPGSQDYLTYYLTHPDNQIIDDRIRSLPGLLSQDALHADPVVFSRAKASFDVIEALRDHVDGPVAQTQLESDLDDFTATIKSLTKHLGARTVGIAKLEPYHIYSHVGRGAGTYGSPIALDHRYAIAFTVEMDRAIMNQAPQAPVVAESARKYVEFAVIAIQLSTLIRELGYPARAHIDGNYQVIAPLVARDAGLGEIGRMGLLMTPELGPRVRVGVVTTDLPLIPDGRGSFDSMIDYCLHCAICAECCPSRAIPFGDRTEIDGAVRWRIDANRCFQYWNVIGTDCGVCMAVCPYSHPDNWAHNAIRWAVHHSGAARRAAHTLDHIVCGPHADCQHGTNCSTPS